jgi:hypothetical protein
MKTIIGTIAISLSIVAIAISVGVVFSQHEFKPISEQTVVIEEKMPVFNFVSYQYVIHTIERKTFEKSYLVAKSDTTLFFEYIGKAQIFVSQEDIQRATISPGRIRISDDMFQVQIADANSTFIGQTTNDIFSNTIPTSEIVASINGVSDSLKRVVIEDGGLTLAKESFKQQYRQLFESVGVTVSFIEIDK